MLPLHFLADIKVLELASVLAGPLAGSFLAELGAEVIKVENKKQGGDVTRQWKLPSENPEAHEGAYYASANYGKKAILLDFTDPGDTSTLFELISKSDVILTNFQKRVAEKYRITPQEIFNQYPQKIIIQLNAFDYDNPRPGLDLIMQAESGYISMNGTEKGELCKLPVPMVDILAAHQMKEAVLLALLKKQATGQGSLVHVSLFQSALTGLVNQASNYLMANVVAAPMGTLHPNIAPYGDVFYSKDKIAFFLGIGSDDQFKKLWKTLNFLEEIPINFVTNTNRLTYRKTLHAELQQHFSQLEFQEWEKRWLISNIPFARIKNIKEVFEDNLSEKMIRESYSENGEKRLTVSQLAFQFLEKP